MKHYIYIAVIALVFLAFAVVFDTFPRSSRLVIWNWRKEKGRKEMGKRQPTVLSPRTV